MYNTLNREQKLANLLEEDKRVQYDGKDAERIENMAELFTQKTIALIESMGEYVVASSSELSDGAVEEMKAARHTLVQAWAEAQLAVSSIASVVRIDGDVAYNRMLKAVEYDTEVDMNGL